MNSQIFGQAGCPSWKVSRSHLSQLNRASVNVSHNSEVPKSKGPEGSSKESVWRDGGKHCISEGRFTHGRPASSN